jgi:hypothetical protein
MVFLRGSIPAMRTRIAAAALMLVFTAVAQTSPSTDKPAPPAPDNNAASSKRLNPGLYKVFGNYGGWWNNISEAEKDSFIDGYTTAMARANSLTVDMCKATMDEAQPGASNFNEKFYGGVDLCFVGQSFAFKVDKPLKPRLDAFYKEPLNVRIPAQFAMEYVRDKLTGTKTAGQLLDELNGWRKTRKELTSSL